MTISHVGQRILVKLVQKLGGVQAAATRLGISPSLVQRFVDGKAQLPDIILLRAVDLALDEVPRPGPVPSRSLPAAKPR